MSDSTAQIDGDPDMAAAKKAWWVPLIMGILAIIFGMMLFRQPAQTAVGVAWVVGIYWFISGTMHLFMLIYDRSNWGWDLALGILGILAGVVVLDGMSQAPLLGTAALATIYVWVLGLQGIVYGILQVVMAFRGAGWGIGTLGVLSVLFGILLMANPFLLAFGLPLIFGVLSLAGGIAAIVVAFKVKSA